MSDVEDRGAGRADVSADVFHEALSTLKAGFLLLDGEGKPVSDLGPALRELGVQDLTLPSLERLRQLAVDENGEPLAPDNTPVYDAIFRDAPMHDLVIGFRPDGGGDPDAARPVQRWLRMNSRRIVVDGRSCVLLTAVDVTQLRFAEERRRELEAAVAVEQRRFAVMFEHIGDVIMVFDENGGVLFGSPSSERILGWPAGYREEGGILELVHPDDRERAAVALATLIDGTRGPTDAIIVRVRTAWGDWRYMECVGVNMLHEPSIEGIVVTARDVTERHRLNLALEHAATHDQLTGLPNRAMFSAHLVTALARGERRGSSSALCYIDIDGFKRVNDRHGHGTGDLLLEEVAQRIRECLRPSDVPSRLGGDEFALVLEDVDPRSALPVAERLLDRLSAPFEVAGTRLNCGASIGVALARHLDTTESWLARADAALYAAKRAGGGVVRLADPEVEDRATTRA